ncbi:MAG: RHS repeat-associated core domain-containing protein, partial [Bacteroidota bacterium]
FPTDANTQLEMHSVTYYDDYDLGNDGTDMDDPSYLAPPNTLDYEIEASTWTRNAVTSTKTGILEEDGSTNSFLLEHIFYDDRARVIQTQSDHHLNGEDVTFSSYNFPGWLLKSERQHNAIVQGMVRSYTIKERYDYDHTGREITMYHEIDTNGEKEVCRKTYDERDLLIQKKLHEVTAGNNNFLQQLDYQYNIRKWMTNINDVTDDQGCTPSESSTAPDLFSMRLLYEEDIDNDFNIFSTQYNGNIASMEWINGLCGVRRAYTFEYDRFDRLTSADQYFYGGTYSNVDRYSVPLIEYDLDGNILRLQRKSAINGSAAGSLIDDLTYTYSSLIPNHLQSVADAANATHPNIGFKGGISSYTYDLNGNLKTDSHKGFTMDYNYLNLPYKVAFNTANLNPTQDFIEWQYDALGQKLQKKVTGTGNNESEKEYCNGIEYNNGDLEAIYFSEGRLVPDGMNWVYEYTLADHLGNNRVTFKDDGMGVAEVIDENHYYPFGMLIEELTDRMNPTDNDYLYNGKELDEEFGLDLHHYGFRLYDASIARFSSVDPIAEDFAFVSPFNYAENEPIANIDLHGLQSLHNAAARGLEDRLKSISSYVENKFNQFFGTSSKKINIQKDNSPTFVKVNFEASGKVVAGMGAGVKGNIMGVKVEAEADIGSVKLAEGSTNEGTHLVGENGEVRTERGGALAVGLTDQLSVGVEAERESAVQNGSTISDTQTAKAGVQIGSKFYGAESTKELVTDGNGKIKSTDPNSKTTTLSIGIGGQFIIGAEGKLKLNITTSKTKPSSDKNEG